MLVTPSKPDKMFLTCMKNLPAHLYIVEHSVTMLMIGPSTLLEDGTVLIFLFIQILQSLLEPNQVKPQRNFKAETQVETSELYCVIEIITYVACFLRNSSVSERAKRRPPCARICLRHFCF